MIRVFKHYVPQGLLMLLIAEAFNNFLAIYITQLILENMLSSGDKILRLSEVISNAVMFTLVMMISMIAMGLYERNFLNGKGDMLLRIGISFLLGSFAMIFMTFVIHYDPSVNITFYYSQHEFGISIATAFIGVLMLRLMFLTASDYDWLKRRVLVLGVGRQAAQLEELWRNSKTNSKMTSVIVGYVQVHKDEKLLVPHDRMFQITDLLFNLVDKFDVNEIVVALDDRRKGFPVDEIMQCKFKGVLISNFLNFYEKQTGKIQLDALLPSNIIFASGFRALHKRFVKRFLDITACLFLLALTWPIMLLAALAIWIESGGRGPILYRQTRVGLNERLFEVIKLRSMRVDAESDGIARWAKAKDSRITRVGALLRKTRIDELPQLFNVLWGDMSFVGPRPERPQFVAELREQIPFYPMRHIVKPGITGWAQICYPYGASVHDAREKLQYDLYYIKNYSFVFDTLILLQTAHTIFWSKGAH